MLEIKNFDHGLNSGQLCRIGSLTLVVTPTDIAGLGRLHSPAALKENFSSEADSPSREVEPKRVGTWATTAHIVLGEDAEEAVLADDAAAVEWDFCLLASFITGRVVCMPEQTHRFRPDVCGDTVVHRLLTLKALQIAWGHRHQLRDDGVVAALTSCIRSNGTSDLNEKANNLVPALNVLYDAQWQRNGVKLFPKSDARMVRASLKACVDDLELSDAQKGDLKGALNNVARASARTQLTHLLIELGIVGESPTEEEQSWIKVLNDVRNAFVHRAAPSAKLKNIDDDQQLSVNVAIIAGVLPTLVRYALVSRLGLQEMPGPSNDLTDLKSFFSKGTFRGQNIGAESGAEALRRRGWELED